MSASKGRTLGCVVIGRNEGERLVQCLKSIAAQTQTEGIVYVDSGSTDSSVAVAKGMGIDVVALDKSIPFSAARARNAGYARLKKRHQALEFVQFIDGDCQLIEGWLVSARTTLEGAADLAVVCGKQNERFPHATIWNRLLDYEWDGPAGEVESCGGNAMIRCQALDQVCGYRSGLIAGEEPEMCYRMRQRGWRILRLSAGMALHDADITRFSQWWQRNRRSGHAYAEVAALHRADPEQFWVAQTRRALIWGAGLPFLTALALFISPRLALLFLAAWPAQVLRLMKVRGMPWHIAIFVTLGKMPEAQGVLGYFFRRLIGRRRSLIEYK